MSPATTRLKIFLSSRAEEEILKQLSEVIDHITLW